MSHNPRVLDIRGEDDAKDAFRAIGVDAGGIEIMARKAVCRLVKVENVEARAANILKQEMLARDGEAAVARGVYDLKRTSSDVILIGTTACLRSLVEKIKQQPFGLKDLAVEIKDVLDAYDSRLARIQWDGRSLDFSKKTCLMGVLNVTPDSFSDGGRFFDKQRAVDHALDMVEQGAGVIDVGGESTRPGAESVSEEDELGRVIPVVEAIADKVSVPVSIDTYKYEIAGRALDAGASIINDISGLRSDERMAALAAERNVPVIIMHMQGTPKDMQDEPVYKSVMGEITAFLRERAAYAVSKGIARDMIIVDPGIGFGKTVEHNLTIMNRLSELKSLGFPIAVGMSRKSFIGKTLDLPVDDRLEGTAATVSLAIARGADIVRVHDVKEMARVARMTDAMIRTA